MNDYERIEQLELENKVLKDNNKGLKSKIDELQKENEYLKERNRNLLMQANKDLVSQIDKSNVTL